MAGNTAQRAGWSLPVNTPRRHIPILLLTALLALTVASMATTRTTAPARAQIVVPDTVMALLPAGAVVQDAQTADFTNAGADGWAVLYTAPGDPPSAAFANWSVAVAVPSGSAFALGTTVSINDANIGVLTVADVAGTPAVALEAGVGAHASQITVVRWDGAEFATVFAGNTDTPGYDFADVDGDGQPEVVEPVSPYCQSYASSPQIVVVYKWDGAQFGEWSGPYPMSLIARRLANARQLTQQMGSWAPQDQACVWGVVAFLEAHAGNATDADNACQQAKAIAPTWEDPHDCPNYILDPAQKVRRFYEEIGAQQPYLAWGELSSAYQAAHGNESTWAQGYATTQSVAVQRSQVSLDDPTVVNVAFTATDSINGQTVTRSFAGTWTVVMEDGVWKLDSANIAETP